MDWIDMQDCLCGVVVQGIKGVNIAGEEEQVCRCDISDRGVDRRAVQVCPVRYAGAPHRSEIDSRERAHKTHASAGAS